MHGSRDAPRKPGWPKRSYAYVGLIVLGLLAGLALAEAWVRIVRWTPRTQMVRGNCLHSMDGVPVWGCETDSDHIRRQNRACVEQHPERTRILFFGSSITYGSGMTAEETFTTALQARLNQSQPAPGFCVLNFAEPGFQFEQKYALARVEVERYKPALIMWESWVEWRKYRIIGDTAYEVADYELRPDGFIGIAGVPGGLNRILFLHSRLYEYLTLSFGERASGGLDERDGWTVFANERLMRVVQLAEAVGAKLVLYFAPHLDRPFAETVASPALSETVLLQFTQARGIPAYSLAHELIDQDYLALRLDPCCHYNAAGHRALVQVMEHVVLEQLEGAAAAREGHSGQG